MREQQPIDKEPVRLEELPLVAEEVGTEVAAGKEPVVAEEEEAVGTEVVEEVVVVEEADTVPMGAPDCTPVGFAEQELKHNRLAVAVVDRIELEATAE